VERPSPILINLLTVIAVVAILRFAEPILMPFAIAILLCVVLTPAVRRVERIGIGRVPAVVLVALLASSGVLGVGYVVVGQVTQIVQSLPEYRTNVREKMRTLRESFLSLERAARQMRELEKDIAEATHTPVREEPPRVQVVEKPLSSMEVIRTYLGSVAGPLGTVGLVVVMIIFILIQREDLRDRLLRVVGHRDLSLTTAAIGDAETRVTRYLRAYTLLNIGHGVAVATGLWLFGLPAAMLFGLLSALLRFIPYVGPWTAAILPVTLSVAVFDSWTSTVMIVAYLSFLELVSNNVFEPWLYGSSVGLSSFAVIVSAVFWAWVWGAVGLVVAIPLTVCVVVIGRHVPRLEFLAILLGDVPAFAPAVRLYQRLLARDVDEAEELVEDVCEERGVEAACDTLVLPALSLLQYDRELGRVEEDDALAAREAFTTVASAIVTCDAKARAKAAEKNGSAAAEAHVGAPRIACLPASAFGDEIACELLVRALEGRGANATPYPRQLTGEMVDKALADEPDRICISALPPGGARVARQVCRQISLRNSKAQVLVALWGADEIADDLRQQCEASCSLIVTSFADACRILSEPVAAENSKSPKPQRALAAASPKAPVSLRTR